MIKHCLASEAVLRAVALKLVQDKDFAELSLLGTQEISDELGLKESKVSVS